MSDTSTQNTKTPDFKHLNISMRAAGRWLGHMLFASEISKEGLLVLIDALERQPFSTAETLAKEWADELGGNAVDEEAINMALELHRLFGSEWNVICLHYHFRQENEEARNPVGDTAEDCPLYGDDVDDIHDIWERELGDFALKREREEAAAQAWIMRQARKAA